MIKGLILAGGKSSRMGFDKSLINYHGKPHREFLFDLLSQFCTEVHVSCKKTDDVPQQLNPLLDQYDIESPLNGILSAFSKDPSSAWLALAVDMPFIDSVTLQFLISNRGSDKVATCFLDSDGKNPEPLLTLWESNAFPLLQSFYRAGNISPRSFLIQHDVHILSAPDKNVLVNINSHDELNRFNEDAR